MFLASVVLQVFFSVTLIDTKKEVNVDLSFIIAQSISNMEAFKQYLIDKTHVSNL